MDRKIRVGAVSYLNTKPLIYAFESGMMMEELELVIDYPSSIGQKLIENTIDIGLVPVAILPQLNEYEIISEYCIACDGPVASVCLFSDCAIDDIKEILLDYQSTTSVALLKILLNEHWKVSPILTMGAQGYENEISVTTAGLVIGDRAFGQRYKSRFCYDLGSAWKDLTGLPFVFAAWVSNKKVPPDFINRFNDANKAGVNNLEKVVMDHPYALFNLQDYYTTNIKFKPAFDKVEVINLFLKKLNACK